MNNIFKVNEEKSISALIISIIIAEGIGLLSAFLGMSNSKTYMNFNKPSFSPPSWVFPVVWTILFLLMAIAAYRIWLRGKQFDKLAAYLMIPYILWVSFAGVLNYAIWMLNK